MGNEWGSDWAGLGFWLFIAACVLAGTWEKIRKNAEKHETLRRIVEKTGTIDESKLKELFTHPAADWSESAAPGGGYRALRIMGTIVISIGAGLAVFALILGWTEVMSRLTVTILLSAACAIAMVGLALFLSSRYAARPPGREEGPGAR